MITPIETKISLAERRLYNAPRPGLGLIGNALLHSRELVVRLAREESREVGDRTRDLVHRLRKRRNNNNEK